MRYFFSIEITVHNYRDSSNFGDYRICGHFNKSSFDTTFEHFTPTNLISVGVPGTKVVFLKSI